MKNEICKFCNGERTAIHFDMAVCEKTCGSMKTCSKGFDCEIAGGIDLCPDCHGLGYNFKNSNENN